jgi:hypothetical protein
MLPAEALHPTQASPLDSPRRAGFSSDGHFGLSAPLARATPQATCPLGYVKLSYRDAARAGLVSSRRPPSTAPLNRKFWDCLTRMDA